MKTAYHIIIVLCFSIIASALIMAMYMLSDGVYFNPPLQVTGEENVTTTQAVYRLGEEVEATITYCKNRSIAGIIDWQLVDTYVRFYPAQRADLPNGCHSYIMDLGKVPGDVLGETYHFTGLLTYKINSLTSVSYPLISNAFRVETP
jgi:hypothetical protein